MVRATGLIAALLITAVLACGDSATTGNEDPVVRLVILPDADTINALGDTTELTVRLETAAGDQQQAPDVVWKSLDGGVEVTDAGKVIGNAVGAKRVVARSGALADTAVVVVRQVAYSLSVLRDVVGMFVGDTLRINIVAVDSNDVPIPAGSFAWSSSTSAVSVDSGGLLRAVSPGAAVVRASIPNRGAEIYVESLSAPVGPVTRFSFHDPAADTLNFSGTVLSTWTPDVRNLFGYISSDSLVLTTLFAQAIAPASVESPSASIGGLIDIDIDENGATGDPSSTGRDTYREGFGTDWSIWLGDSAGVRLNLVQYGPTRTYRSVPVTFRQRSFTVSVPLNVLGPDDGRMNIGGKISEKHGTGDVFPNAGYYEIRRTSAAATRLPTRVNP